MSQNLIFTPTFKKNNKLDEEALKWDLYLSKTPQELQLFFNEKFCKKFSRVLKRWTKKHQYFTEKAHLFACVVFALRENPLEKHVPSPHVPSPMEYYLDVYDEEFDAYTGMTLDKKKKYQKDLEKFVKTFCKDSNVLYKDFSDIPFAAAKKTMTIAYGGGGGSVNPIAIYCSAVVEFNKKWKKGRETILKLLKEEEKHVELKEYLVEYIISMDEEYAKLNELFSNMFF
jgi:hypothetical protein